MADKKQGGFTMLELSVVLIIVGLVTTVGVSSGISAIESARRAQTESKLSVIEAAMMTFRINNNRLPCPANLVLVKGNTNYGNETTTPGVCSGSNFGTAGGVVEGGVPTKALNIPEDFMYDGWGRRIAYAVDSNITDIDAFNAIAIPESCGITVNDASRNPRTDSAAYVLVSFGPDGHGGYLGNGTRMKTGATNADVLTNCHCDSDANTASYLPRFVQKEALENPTTPRESFANFVRFKERWQMSIDEDQLNFALGGSYRGPNVAAGFELPVAGTNSTYIYKLQCGRLVKQDDLDPPSTEASTGVAYTNDNRYLVTFSAAGCMMYPINDSVMDIGSALSIPNCPAYDPSVKIDLSPNGFMAMIAPSAPYVFAWQKSGSSFVPLATPSPAPSGPVSMLSLTSNYMALSDGVALLVYARSSTSYTALATQPAGVPTSIFSIAISPNESYVAVTEDGNVSGTPAPGIYVWRIDVGPTFNLRPRIDIANNDTPYGLTFSPDGKYFAVGGTSGANVMIYKIDAGDSFSRLDLPTGWTNSVDTPGIAFSFSRNSNYLVMGTPSSLKPLALFRQVSSREYKQLAAPAEIQPYPAVSVRFNR
jgi:prepilin-type N-terminal cleavage/methylation domain-containing protein